MAAVVQWLERQIVALDVVGSNPIGRPIDLFQEYTYCPVAIGRNGRMMLEAMARMDRIAKVMTKAFWVFLLIEKRERKYYCAVSTRVVWELVPFSSVIDKVTV